MMDGWIHSHFHTISFDHPFFSSLSKPSVGGQKGQEAEGAVPVDEMGQNGLRGLKRSYL